MKDLIIPFGDRNIVVKKRRNLKSLSLRIKPFSDFSLNIPYGVSLSVVNEFIASKEQWMGDALIRIKEIENEDRFIIEEGRYKTKYHIVEVKRSERSEHISFNMSDDCFTILFPTKYDDLNDEHIQEGLKSCIIELWRYEAKINIPQRVNELATQFGFKYNKIFIKNLKSKWGSCSAVNNINLNLFLMNIPDYLVDYIILHELVHTKVKNHSSEFWSMLNRCVPDAKKIDKELKNYSLKVRLEKI